MIDLNKSLFLTFDLDWACDEVIEDTLSIIIEENVKATFFITHKSHIIEQIVKYSKIERGLHPNFNPILEDVNCKNYLTIIERIRDVVPEATSIRSHSLFQSSRLFNEFVNIGMNYDLNMFIPHWSKIVLRPYKEYNGIMRIPYFWEDDIHFSFDSNVDWKVAKYFDMSGLKVFDFHPIHVYLNTEKNERYIMTEGIRNDINKLKEYRNQSHQNGTRNFLIDLIRQAKKRNFKFYNISDI